VMSLDAFLAATPGATEQQIRETLSGHICRCTGYTGIVDAAVEAAAAISSTNSQSVEV